MTGSPRFVHSRPLLKSLLWLSGQYRINLTYQLLRSCRQPSYLLSLLTPVRNPIQLRSSGSDLLFIPRVNTNIGTMAVFVAASTLWNMFPSSVRSVENITKFRRHLKRTFRTLPIHHSSLVYQQRRLFTNLCQIRWNF